MSIEFIQGGSGSGQIDEMVDVVARAAASGAQSSADSAQSSADAAQSSSDAGLATKVAHLYGNTGNFSVAALNNSSYNSLLTITQAAGTAPASGVYIAIASGNWSNLATSGGLSGAPFLRLVDGNNNVIAHEITTYSTIGNVLQTCWALSGITTSSTVILQGRITAPGGTCGPINGTVSVAGVSLT